MTLKEQKHKPNWLLRWLLGVSLAVHLVLLGQIAGLYNARSLVFIDLALRNISKSFSRDIPRPRLRPKDKLKPHETRKLKAVKPVPHFKPLVLDPADKDMPDGIGASLSSPEIPGLKGIGADAADRAFTSARDYLELVKNSIQRAKRYPQPARTRQIEGRVSLQFIVGQDGSLKDVRVIGPCPHEILNEAALTAIRDASPFPRPPPRFFKGDVPLKIVIAFELTLF